MYNLSAWKWIDQNLMLNDSILYLHILHFPFVGQSLNCISQQNGYVHTLPWTNQSHVVCAILKQGDLIWQSDVLVRIPTSPKKAPHKAMVFFNLRLSDGPFRMSLTFLTPLPRRLLPWESFPVGAYRTFSSSESDMMTLEGKRNDLQNYYFIYITLVGFF